MYKYLFTSSGTSHLKSNMDRFIVTICSCIKRILINLKSNMDRFIGLPCTGYKENSCHLKSNMDRFIAVG